MMKLIRLILFLPLCLSISVFIFLLMAFYGSTKPGHAVMDVLLKKDYL